MRNVRLIVAAAVLLQASPALARAPVPIQDWPAEAVVTASGNRPTAEQVEQAALVAVAAKGWTPTRVADGRYSLRKLVRGKHTVVVSLSVAATQYGIVYESSDNMKYTTVEGVPHIHPNYNVWARELVEAIRAEVARL